MNINEPNYIDRLLDDPAKPVSTGIAQVPEWNTDQLTTEITTSIPVLDGTKIMVTNDEQSKELAKFISVVHAPLAEDQKKPVAEPNKPEANADAVPSDSSDMPPAFEIGFGSDKAMMVLHPQSTGDLASAEPLRIVINMAQGEWKSWIRPAFAKALTQGYIISSDGHTVLKAVVVHATNPLDGTIQKIAFRFDQIAGVLPFNEVNQTIVDQRKAQAHRRLQQREADEVKRKKAKISAKSRKRNQK